MSKPSYYEILELQTNASEEEIKKAYRSKAMKFHPDRNPGDKEAEENFKQAAEAYDVLRDPQKRANYDKYGTADPFGNGGAGFSSADDIFSSFGDIFGDLFGFNSRQRGPRARQGDDLRYNLTIAFREAAKGIQKTIIVPRTNVCDTCHGDGAAPGSHPETCKHCNGAGVIRQNAGFFQVNATCSVCRGAGKVITTPCKTCKGRGFVEVERSLDVKIPAGVFTGARMRLRGEGDSGENGGPNGDLYIFITVEDDAIFERQDQDLIYRVSISFVNATLGARVQVPTLDESENGGEIEFDIPAGTQPGTVLKIPGKGLPYPNESRVGDLLLPITVEIPTDISKEQADLLLKYETLEKRHNSKITTKVKKLFKK